MQCHDYFPSFLLRLLFFDLYVPRAKNKSVLHRSPSAMVRRAPFAAKVNQKHQAVVPEGNTGFQYYFTPLSHYLQTTKPQKQRIAKQRMGNNACVVSHALFCKVEIEATHPKQRIKTTHDAVCVVLMRCFDDLRKNDALFLCVVLKKQRMKQRINNASNDETISELAMLSFRWRVS